jgi:hypothetical protein
LLISLLPICSRERYRSRRLPGPNMSGGVSIRCCTLRMSLWLAPIMHYACRNDTGICKDHADQLHTYSPEYR